MSELLLHVMMWKSIDELFGEECVKSHEVVSAEAVMSLIESVGLLLANQCLRGDTAIGAL